MKGFDVLIGQTCCPIESALLARVNPRSCGAAGQGSKEWFLDRMFSGTSSQVHLLIQAAAPLLVSDPAVHDETKNAIRKIVEYTKHNLVSDVSAPEPEPALTPEPVSTPDPQSVPAPAPVPDQTSTPAAVPPPELASTPAPAPEPESQEVVRNESPEEKEAKEWIVKLTDPTKTVTDDVFLAELPSIDNKAIGWMIHILSKNKGLLRINPQAANEKKIKTWLKSDRAHRHLIFVLKLQLLEIAKKKGMPKIPEQKTKLEIIKKIVDFDSRPTSNTNDENGRNETNNRNNNSNRTFGRKELAPLVAILGQSFLRPQKPKSERSAARIGQQNEEVFLRQFWELYNDKKFDLPDGFEPLSLQVIFRPSLVSKKGDNHFVKDSADGVAVFKKSDGEVSEKRLSICCEFLLLLC